MIEMKHVEKSYRQVPVPERCKFFALNEENSSSSKGIPVQARARC